jgi:hypothetical protein
MISKDESIVTQVAMKAAVDLVIGLTPKEADLTAVLSDVAVAFQSLRTQLADVHNEDGLMIAFGPGTQVVAETAAPTSYAAPAPVGEVTIVLSKDQKDKGYQPEPLPSWAIAAAKKAGVAKVFDNRLTAVNTKRPWFKEALSKEQQDAGKEPTAFWPPKAA